MHDGGSSAAVRDILVVDDSSTFCGVLGMFLKSQGYDVATTSGAKTAVEMFHHNKFKMMITDFNMPGMNGIELAEAIRKKHSDVVILMITGTADDVVDDAVSAGVAEIFPKPVNLQKLREAVTASLSSWRSTTA